jgi:AraC-like DNA-binding protein
MREDNLSTLQIPAFSIGVMADVLRRAGIDPTPAFESADLRLDAPLPSSGFVSAKAEIAFERAFHELTTGRRDLWTEVGRRHCLAAYGLFGLATTTSPTLRHFVENSVKTRDFCITFCEFWPVERAGELCGIEVVLDAVPEDLREISLFRELGAMMTTFDSLWRGSTRGFCLELDIAGEDGRFMQEFAPFKLRFDRPQTMLTWPAEVTDVPLPYGNEFLHGYYVDRCNALFNQVPGTDLVARITRAITMQPAINNSIDTIARRLNMSVRTLQRRLNEDGLTFRGVLMRAQADIAKSYLRETTLSIAQIAAQLGYADRTSFDLAFANWTGASPRKFRDSAHMCAVAEV